MGIARFLGTSLVPSSDSITPSSQAAGTTSRAQKEAYGSASMSVTGSYSGLINRDYVVRITATGAIGAATFEYSDDGGTSIAGSGTTSASPVSLNNGLSVAWTAGVSGTDLFIGDVWRFKAYLANGRFYMLQRDRDTEWRSAGVGSTVTVDFDLASALAPKALVLLDHNLTAGATIRIQASAASNYSPLTVNELVPYTAAGLVYYMSNLTAYRYWRISVTDTGNPAGYLRWSNVFLGSYTQLQTSFDLGDVRGKGRVGKRERTLSGKFYGELNTVVRSFDLSWVRMSLAERDALVALFDSTNDLVNRQVLPIFFNPDSEVPSEVYLCEWHEGEILPLAEQDAPEYFTVPVRLVEIPRTV